MCRHAMPLIKNLKYSPSPFRERAMSSMAYKTIYSLDTDDFISHFLVKILLNVTFTDNEEKL